MKSNFRLHIWAWFLFVSTVVFVPDLVNAQGTLYVSSLVTTMSRGGGANVANNSWIAEQIETGDNPSGYVLNSLELAVGGANNATGFTVSIYSDVNSLPSTDLGTLVGSSDPTGEFTTYSASDLTLAASTQYFVVATATTSSFEWVSGVGSSATGIEQWIIGGSNLESSDQGGDWTTVQGVGDLQLAIYATPVPEPSPWILSALGGGLIYAFARAKRQ